jgi:hypothetical protein
MWKAQCLALSKIVYKQSKMVLVARYCTVIANEFFHSKDCSVVLQDNHVPYIQ